MSLSRISIIKHLISSAVHLGNGTNSTTNTWNPKTSIYLYGQRTWNGTNMTTGNGKKYTKKTIHIIDLEQTIFMLRRAMTFIQKLCKKRGYILFVPHAQEQWTQHEQKKTQEKKNIRVEKKEYDDNLVAVKTITASSASLEPIKRDLEKKQEFWQQVPNKVVLREDSNGKTKDSWKYTTAKQDNTGNGTINFPCNTLSESTLNFFYQDFVNDDKPVYMGMSQSTKGLPLVLHSTLVQGSNKNSSGDENAKISITKYESLSKKLPKKTILDTNHSTTKPHKYSNASKKTFQSPSLGSAISNSRNIQSFFRGTIPTKMQANTFQHNHLLDSIFFSFINSSPRNARNTYAPCEAYAGTNLQCKKTINKYTNQQETTLSSISKNQTFVEMEHEAKETPLRHYPTQKESSFACNATARQDDKDTNKVSSSSKNVSPVSQGFPKSTTIRELVLGTRKQRNQRFIIPEALFLFDTIENQTLIREAIKLQIPIIAIICANSNPFGIDYPIPGNTQSLDSLDLYTQFLFSAISDAKKKEMQAIALQPRR